MYLLRGALYTGLYDVKCRYEGISSVGLQRNKHSRPKLKKSQVAAMFGHCSVDNIATNETETHYNTIHTRARETNQRFPSTLLADDIDVQNLWTRLRR